MATQLAQVAVLGAGVIGLPLATHLVETFSTELVVTLIADKFSPDTTSDMSGGMLQPESPVGTSEEVARIKRWCTATFDHVSTLYNSPEGCKSGATLAHGYYVCTNPAFQKNDPWFRDLFLGFREASAAEKAMFPPQDFRVFAFSTYLLRCRTYLPWLKSRFIQQGGIIIQKKVENLSELSSYDVVINCTGLGAATLVSDASMYPAKGQLVSVSAPWVQHFFLEGGWSAKQTYIFPRSLDNGKKEVLLGGCFHENDCSEEISPDINKAILQRCQAAMPNLTGAEVLDTWVGHRPMRKGGVRLEREEGSHHPVVIHCYGHGGAGVTLHWGCVLDVTDLLRDALGLAKCKL